MVKTSQFYFILLILSGMISLHSWNMGNKLKKFNFNNILSKKLSHVLIGSILLLNGNSAKSVETASSFANQLKLVQAQQVSAQQKAFEDAELQAINREIKWPEGRLIARGAVLLQPTGTDLSQFPLGVLDVSALDPVFSGDESSLFILGVGRDNLQPVAAKKIKLKDLTFPLMFELETADLIFPYNAESWTASSNSKDSIAVTCIISPGNKLSTPNTLNLIGFALSEPVNIAGSLQRSTARIFVNGRIDTNLYTKEEVTLLSGIDTALENKSLKK
jgi:hypothetical protein